MTARRRCDEVSSHSPVDKAPVQCGCDDRTAQVHKPRSLLHLAEQATHCGQAPRAVEAAPLTTAMIRNGPPSGFTWAPEAQPAAICHRASGQERRSNETSQV